MNGLLKVIIVEDEDIIRKGLVSTLDWVEMDCMVVADAKDGIEGLEMILELKPDVVITDIKMPRLDGIGMLRQASSMLRFKSIILTSYAEFEYARQAIELKACDYLLKPVDEDKVKVLIERIHEEIEIERSAAVAMENAKKDTFDLAKYIQMDKSESGYVAEAIRRIQSDYREKISIESISDDLMVSSSYLTRKFKEVTGHKFLDFLNLFRVQQAVKLLSTGRYRVYEISEMTGFTDYKHFCTVFKRYTSMSPMTYIKKKGLQ